MRYAEIKFNDIANGDGIGVSLFVQGCPIHCKGCFNNQTWDFKGGKEFTQDTLNSIINGITANGINRHFSILGGEPFCKENLILTNWVVNTVREKFPNITIYAWTGYEYEDLSGELVDNILSKINFLIVGPYIEELRNISLPLRGSSNQRIIKL